MRALIQRLSDEDVDSFVPLGYKKDESYFWRGASVFRIKDDLAVAISADGISRVMRFETHVHSAQTVYVVSDNNYRGPR